MGKALSSHCMNEFVSRLSYDTLCAMEYFTLDEELAMEEAKGYFTLDLDFSLFLENLNDDAVEHMAVDLGIADTVSRQNIEKKVLELGTTTFLIELDDDTLQQLYNKFHVSCIEDIIKKVIP